MPLAKNIQMKAAQSFTQLCSCLVKSHRVVNILIILWSAKQFSAADRAPSDES